MQIVPEIWPTWAALADDLGSSYPTVHSWSRRGLPPKRFAEIIQAAARRGVQITFEMLAGNEGPMEDHIRSVPTVQGDAA